MTEQGVNIVDFSDQLIEVKTAWADALRSNNSFVKDEAAAINIAIKSWDLALDDWKRKQKRGGYIDNYTYDSMHQSIVDFIGDRYRNEYWHVRFRDGDMSWDDLISVYFTISGDISKDVAVRLGAKM